MKITGITVGTTLPKSNFDQTDPSKGDYIKGDRSFLTSDETLTKKGKFADAKAVGDAISGHNTSTTAHADIRAEITTATSSLKDELLNGAGEAYDTLKELGDLIDENHDAIDALEIVATGKQNKLSGTDGQVVRFDSEGNAVAQDFPQSDWNQNDETALDYVKNRQFYETDPSAKIIAEEQDVAIYESDGMFGGELVLMNNTLFVVGQVYTVSFNNTDYECVAYAVDEKTTYIGNGALESSINGTGNGEPFIIISDGTFWAYILISDANDTVVVSVTTIQSDIIKLPIKYLENSNIVNDDTYGGGLKTIGAKLASSHSFAEGIDTVAIGTGSHAEGVETAARGSYSHAEGCRTVTNARFAHAEGYESVARGESAHAQGTSTTASGNNSHAEGVSTIAASSAQHTQGKYNIEDSAGTYAHIVGNGRGVLSSFRSNAHTLDWDGNAWFAGDVYVGSTSGTNKDEGSVKLQKEITGTQGQVVGFDANGNPIAQDPASSMPEVTTSDNGKFLRVVNGAWAAATVPNAEEVAF